MYGKTYQVYISQINILGKEVKNLSFFIYRVKTEYLCVC